MQSILDEVGDIQAGANYTTVPRTEATSRPDNLPGPQEIIREMDSDRTDGLRHRRVTTNLVPTSSVASSSSHDNEASTTVSTAHSSEDKTANTDNCTNENSENGNVIEDIATDTIDAPFPQAAAAAPQSLSVQPQLINNSDGDGGSNDRENEFRIKLKYLNDDLKLVKGCPNEAIGDFKK